MVDLEDREPFDRLQPISEGIEPGAENDDLANAGRDRALRGLFGDPAACGDERPQPAASGIGLGLGDRGLGVRAKDRYRKGVGKDAAALEALMSSAVAGGAERGAAELSVLHAMNLPSCPGNVQRRRGGTGFCDKNLALQKNSLGQGIKGDISSSRIPSPHRFVIYWAAS